MIFDLLTRLELLSTLGLPVSLLGSLLTRNEASDAFSRTLKWKIHQLHFWRQNSNWCLCLGSKVIRIAFFRWLGSFRLKEKKLFEIIFSFESYLIYDGNHRINQITVKIFKHLYVPSFNFQFTVDKQMFSDFNFTSFCFKWIENVGIEQIEEN